MIMNMTTSTTLIMTKPLINCTTYIRLTITLSTSILHDTSQKHNREKISHILILTTNKHEQDVTRYISTTV